MMDSRIGHQPFVLPPQLVYSYIPAGPVLSPVYSSQGVQHFGYYDRLRRNVIHMGHHPAPASDDRHSTSPSQPSPSRADSPPGMSACHPTTRTIIPPQNLVDNGHSFQLQPVNYSAKSHAEFNQVKSTEAPVQIDRPQVSPTLLKKITSSEASMAKPEQASGNKMKRTIPADPIKSQDPEYLEKRKKNNEAAKKSREARKIKEDSLTLRLQYLEDKHLRLTTQLAVIEEQKRQYLQKLNN